MNSFEIATELGGVKPNGKDGWMARCPAHVDRSPSLSIKDADGGRVLVHCFGGCAPDNVITALKSKGLWPSNGNGSQVPKPAYSMGNMTPKQKSAFIPQPPKQKAEKAIRRLCGTWIEQEYKPSGLFPYSAIDGTLVFWRFRLDHSEKGKIVRPLWWNGEKWLMKEPPFGSGEKPLYGLNTLTKDHSSLVWIVEGEPKVDALARLGLAAATSGSSSSAEAADWKPLMGRRCRIWPDNDNAGQGYAKDAQRKLAEAEAILEGIIDIEKLGLPGHGDVIDWLKLNPGATKSDIDSLPLVSVSSSTTHESNGIRPKAKTIRLADVMPEDTRWLWPGRFALGKVSMISGDPGLGKSLITLDMAAHVSKGRSWPDGSECPKGAVILISGEDDPADTIRPRLDAAGADVDCIHQLTAVVRIDRKTSAEMETNFELFDLGPLDEAITRISDVRLVIIDPISAYLGGADSHNNSDVRSLLTPLAELARKHEIAIVCVNHLNKGQGAAIYRMSGSIAFVAAARAAFAVAKDKDDPKRRLMLPVKNNLALDQGGLAYHVETTPSGAPIIAWEADPVIDVDIEQAMGAQRGETRQGGKLSDAAEWLRNILLDGPMEADQLEVEAKAAGISWATIRRAKNMAGADSRKRGFDRGWEWYLIEDAQDKSKMLSDKTKSIFGENEHLGRNTAQESLSVDSQ